MAGRDWRVPALAFLEEGYLNSVRALRFGSLRSDDDCSRVAELLAELSS